MIWKLYIFIFSTINIRSALSVNQSPPDKSWRKSEALCACGQISSDNEVLDERILGGLPAKPHSYPWMAIVLHKKIFQCGGSLINNRYTLTSSHCVVSLNAKSVQVGLGIHDRITMDDGNGLIMQVMNILIHHKYKRNSVYDSHDIALLKVSDVVQFTDHITPICLPQRDLLLSSVSGSIAGWGLTTQDGKPSRFLRTAVVKVLGWKDCKNTTVGRIVKQYVDSMLCAYQAKVDSCQGDSGGPLFLKTAEGSRAQIGPFVEQRTIAAIRDVENTGRSVSWIVSWGLGCGSPNNPGVYTNVAHYLDWIKQNTNDALYCKQ